MSYSIGIDEALKAVTVIREGEAEPEEMRISREEVAALLHKTGYTRLLSNASAMTRGFSVGRNYEYTTSLTRAFPAGIRVAAVVSEPILDEANFAAQISFNRGMNVRLFGDEAAARAWLSEENDTSG